MGKRGPQPKSARNQNLRGNPSKRKPPQIDEPVDLAAEAVGDPDALTKDERKIWDDVVSSMPGWWFTSADKPVLKEYCRVLNLIERSYRALRRQSLVMKRGNGSLCANPHVLLLQAHRDQMLKLQAALHLDRKQRRGLARSPDENPATPDFPEVGAVPTSEFGDLLAAPPSGRYV